ncbi:methyl-accepting chemotaxis protein [uncultured Nisaea sp.]|uniref:methyl-accepting chemotaxis protein n=1 Tax=uncultured Nisaea sp. TaxID=538215 RepID=UPI0030EF2357|tara:strand:+ start:765 stop:2444 length:1680 start_codon:yes stop_codon:yes gene_type:complete
MQKLRVGGRIAAGFFIVLLALFAVGGLAFWSSQQLFGMTEKLHRNSLAVTNAALAANGHILDMRRNMSAILEIRRDADRLAALSEEVSARAADVEAAFAIVEERFLGDKTLVEAARAAFAAWGPVRDEVIALVGQKKRLAADALTKEKGLPLIQEIDDDMHQLIRITNEQADAYIANATTVFNNVIIWIGAATGGAFLLSLIAAALAMRSVTRPLLSLTEAMRGLADGDNDVEIPGTGAGDEIGEMARTVEVFKTNAIENARLRDEQRAMERQAEESQKQTMRTLADEIDNLISSVAEKVAHSADALRNQAGELTRSAGTAKSVSHDATDNAHQMHTDIETVSNAVSELSDSFREVSNQVTQCAEMSVSAVQTADRTAGTVQTLNQAVDQIGEIITLIQDIAEQTNLLALNATIEAARAGDAGKGFAVVASEVKNLATQTAKATVDISEQITQVQTVTRSASDSMTEIRDTISEISERVAVLSAAAEKQSTTTADISHTVRSSVERTDAVRQGLDTVGSAIDQAATISGGVSEQADVFAADASGLRQAVSGFLEKLRMA